LSYTPAGGALCTGSMDPVKIISQISARSRWFRNSTV